MSDMPALDLPSAALSNRSLREPVRAALLGQSRKLHHLLSSTKGLQHPLQTLFGQQACLPHVVTREGAAKVSSTLKTSSLPLLGTLATAQ
eukprot:1412699-Amphidinium_carterae.1